MSVSDEPTHRSSALKEGLWVFFFEAVPSLRIEKRDFNAIFIQLYREARSVSGYTAKMNVQNEKMQRALNT